MSPKKQRVDPRVLRTRQLLYDAFISLIEEHGYDKITVQDITERATVNRATFYLHYRDKQDLLLTSSEDILRELLEHLDPSADEREPYEYSKDQPHPVFLRMFEQIARHADYYRVMLADQRMPHFTARMLEVLENFVQNGLATVLSDDNQLTVPKEIVIRYTASAFLGVIIWWLENDMPLSPKYMATKLMVIATNGPYVNNPFSS